MADYIPFISMFSVFSGVSSVDDICEILNHPAAYRATRCDRAKAQLMTMLLNIASGRLGLECCVPIFHGDKVVKAWDLLRTISSLIEAGDKFSCEFARELGYCDVSKGRVTVPCPPDVGFGIDIPTTSSGDS
jgi:hypothetical protein